jgi:riboflavin synthase
MFTGIVNWTGRVVEAGPRLQVRTMGFADDVQDGESISVSGVCLTVVEHVKTGVSATRFASVMEGHPPVPPETSDEWMLGFDLSPETLERTTLGGLDPNDPVNLERAATLETLLGGHLVQGHVDGVGTITHVRDASPGVEMRVNLPDGLARYVVEKGSITVDGVSLTVTDISDGGFGIALIPFTLEATTLGTAKVDDRVNLEVDVLAKYVE